MHHAAKHLRTPLPSTCEPPANDPFGSGAALLARFSVLPSLWCSTVSLCVAFAVVQYNIPADPALLAVAKKVASTVTLSSSYTVPGTNTTYQLGYTPKIKASAAGMRMRAGPDPVWGWAAPCGGLS